MLIGLSVNFQVLLVDGSTTSKKSWNSLMRYRYRFTQFKKLHPDKFNSLANRVLADLVELEKAVNATDQKSRIKQTC
jgi:hypothetical protein